MYTLKRDNVVKQVESKVMRDRLVNEGFKEMQPVQPDKVKTNKNKEKEKDKSKEAHDGDDGSAGSGRDQNTPPAE